MISLGQLSCASRRVSMLGLAGALWLLLAGSADGAPLWKIDSLANSTVAPGGTLDYIVETANSGDTAMDGSEIDVTARLPPGMVAVSARLTDAATFHTYSCFDARDGVSPVAGAHAVICPNRERVSTQPGSRFQKVLLRVRVDPAAADTLTTTFSVSGGGGGNATTVDPTVVSATPPGFGVDAVDGLVSDAAGMPMTQAGGHPADAAVSIDFNTLTNDSPFLGTVWPVEPVKDVSVDLPPGMVGNPTVLDQCTLPELANSVSLTAEPLCPVTSQVGTATVRLKGSAQGTGGFDAFGPLPVFNVVPPPGSPAAFGFNVVGTVVVLTGDVRSGDFGVTVNGRDLPEGLAIVGTTVDLWGVPSATSHDAQRACRGAPAPWDGGPSCQSGAPPKPFLRLPTSCTDPGVGLPTTARVDSWAGSSDEVTWFSHDLPGYPAAPEDWGPEVGLSGCDRVPFDPKLTATPQSARAGSPTGFSFHLSLPQSDTAAVAESDLKSATVTLPEGVRVSPGSADGLQGCSPAQIALGSDAAPSCPDGSKLGTVSIDTPLLRVPVTGSIYLATPFDNPSHSLLSIYLVASAQGVTLKLAGAGSLDPGTGQISTTFDDNPQLPFSDLHLEFKGGPRAPLALPNRCGTYTTHAVLTGWNGRTVTSDSSFTVSENAAGQPCPSTFSPGFSAGTVSNRAGASSPMLLRFTRSDSDQELRDLTVEMPGGLTGRIAQVRECPDAQAVAGDCPDASKIGDVTVGAGEGTNPFYIADGRAYLTGPYNGAPFGASIVVPAVAGPFDLGNVVVRSAVFVDKHTADVRIVSDPLPQILRGIPLDVRDVRVAVDRPGFWLNPTSCAEKTFHATLESAAGASASVSDRFQAADCASLGFKPRMVMTVGGRGHTARGRSTPFSTSLTMPQRDQTNLRFVRVTLPTTINARLTVINDACTRAQFEANISQCAHAKAGTATAVTPLLRDPLRGSVYFVKNGHPIPDLFVALRGQVAFDLIGRVSIPGGTHLATTFATAPDVPIRSFVLRLFGDSRNGSVGAAANLCSARSRRAKAQVDYVAQNGSALQVAQPLRVLACARSRVRARRRR